MQNPIKVCNQGESRIYS